MPTKVEEARHRVRMHLGCIEPCGCDDDLESAIREEERAKARQGWPGIVNASLRAEKGRCNTCKSDDPNRCDGGIPWPRKGPHPYGIRCCPDDFHKMRASLEEKADAEE